MSGLKIVSTLIFRIRSGITAFITLEKVVLSVLYGVLPRSKEMFIKDIQSWDIQSYKPYWYDFFNFRNHTLVLFVRWNLCNSKSLSKPFCSAPYIRFSNMIPSSNAKTRKATNARMAQEPRERKICSTLMQSSALLGVFIRFFFEGDSKLRAELRPYGPYHRDPDVHAYNDCMLITELLWQSSASGFHT